MSEIIRLIATGFIWSMVAIVVTVGGQRSTDPTALAVVFAIAATISTGMIWQSAPRRSGDDDREANKQKRDRHLTRLVDKLNDDDVYQLEELLASRRDEQYVERDQGQ